MKGLLMGDLNSNISSIEITDEYMEMCDITVEEVHCYYGNGVVTHNSGQELRIAANMSREPAWIEAFQKGEDIHKNTACAVWGADSYDKEKRKLAKGANFAVIYGASAQSFEGDGKTAERPEGMTLREAEDFYDQYRKGVPTLFAYQDRLKARCRKAGVVYTYFGTPRRVKFYYDNGMAGYANRTCLNHPIQGGAGNILKSTMIKLWKSILNHPIGRERSRFLSTVHDEINFSVKVAYLQKTARALEVAMVYSIPEWPITLEVEVSLGWSWGGLHAFYWDDETQHYRPTLL